MSRAGTKATLPAVQRHVPLHRRWALDSWRWPSSLRRLRERAVVNTHFRRPVLRGKGSRRAHFCTTGSLERSFAVERLVQEEDVHARLTQDAEVALLGVRADERANAVLG